MREADDSRRRIAGGAAALAALLVLALGSAAHAARLVDVRVGLHPGYARVVLETDAPAAHQVIAAEGDEVVVRIDAESEARTLAPRGADAPSIALEPAGDGATLARIHSAGPLRVETQVLAAPPRLVLDLRRSARAATAPIEPLPMEREPEASAPPELEAASVEPTPAPEPVEAPAAHLAEAAPALPAHAEPVPEPVAADEPPPAPPTAATPEPALPPVAAPPPASLALDPRSLATGLAVGFAIALFAFAARRPRRAVAPAPAIAATPPEPVAVAEPELAAAPAEAPALEPLVSVEPASAHDLVRMYQRLDARLAEVVERLDAIAARQRRLDARGSAQGLEIASQRAAIAHLRAALRPAPQTPRASEREPSPSPARSG